MTSPLQQKLKVTGPVIVTANRLGDGAVVYLTETRGWSDNLKDAAVVTTSPAALELLAIAKGDGNRAVEPYVAAVSFDGERRILPGNLRERIRSDGPTIPLTGAP